MDKDKIKAAVERAAKRTQAEYPTADYLELNIVQYVMEEIEKDPQPNSIVGKE